ncbi:MAG: HAMP domain-containing sensor histidine kinase [Myxococcota bacterium]|nr:HAMP domain-containing sensor histidine kinase [Myxococcota bacterium]
MQQVWGDGKLCHGMGHERGKKREQRRDEQRKRDRKRVKAELRAQEVELDEDEYRDAVDLAHQKGAFTRDAVQFAFWTALALIFVFPLGVALLIFGAPKRVRRFSKLYLEPPARERPTERELRRRRRAREVEAGAALRARGRAGLELAPVRVSHVLDAVLDPLRPRLERAGIALECQIDGDPVLTADARRLEQAFAHLFAGAVTSVESAADGGGKPRLELDAGENLAGTEVWVRLRDSGPEPDADRRLALARPLVEAHEGRVELGSDPAGGTEVVVTLPRE